MRLALVLVVLLAGCSKSDPNKVTVDDKGFHPSHVELKKGGPGTLTFLRTSDKTCATEVVFKELNVRKELPLNQPVTVDVPTDKPRDLTFACGMGMFESTLTIQ
jgi:plastocyanin domain-containing protein